MTLTYKFNYDGKDLQNILELCKISKNLYNQTLYTVKQELRENNKFLSYKDLVKIMKKTKNLEGTINYRLLKAQVSQQCIRNIDKDIKSYVRSIKNWSGLFQSSCGKLINADVNGSLNILRKVIGDSDNSICRIINSGRLFRPVKCNIL